MVIHIGVFLVVNGMSFLRVNNEVLLMMIIARLKRN